MEESDKIQLLSNMGIAILTSNEIYNFSELLEQPLLKSGFMNYLFYSIKVILLLLIMLLMMLALEM